MAHSGPAPRLLEAPVGPGGERRSPATTGLRKFFDAAIEHEASDLLMRGGMTPQLRLRGDLRPVGVPPLAEIDFEKWIQESMSPHQWDTYCKHGSVDFGFDLERKDGSKHRFRVNVFRTRGRSAVAARRVSNKILTFSELFLPPGMAAITQARQGLVLLCGVTGSGKSTTIAAMLQEINENRPCHILTLEDPIEYLFSDVKAMINQREMGIDAVDFTEGLRALVRENPDVVLIGEMRDRETFEAALHASETGHLVFGTIHASSAAQAFPRIYDLFPAEEREGIRNMLAFQMRAFVYQKLLPTLREDVQRVPAVEVLLQGPATRKFILEGREHELPDVMKQNRDSGMQTFSDSLVKLVNDNLISPKIALANAPNPEELRMLLRGIKTATD